MTFIRHATINKLPARSKATCDHCAGMCRATHRASYQPGQGRFKTLNLCTEHDRSFADRYGIDYRKATPLGGSVAGA